MKTPTTTITERALKERINRALAKEGQKLRASRSESERSSFSNYYVVNLDNNVIDTFGIDDLEDWTRKQMPQRIKPYEHVGKKL